VVACNGETDMADPSKVVEQNVDGKFFVDTTCINCDTCRQLAPHNFRDIGEYSSVFHQPTDQAEERDSYRALLSCPTGSIGARGKNQAKEYIDDFPLLIDDQIYYNGFNSEKSYGANSYFIKHPQGNWLVDSPKFLPHFAKKLEKLGGIKYIFLTHRDDVADAAKYAEMFKAERIIHEWDLDAQPSSEIVISGTDETDMAGSFKIIPVPGHTKGHMVLLFKDKFLFTGDHLHYEPESNRLAAYRSVCWYSWAEQTKSMARLAEYDFEWVLAGHGNRGHLPLADMKEQMHDLVGRMGSYKGRN
jgi:glyoxylase-like metal-dependent hydrolase (beta-lactamase superfamily II)/ferredoxin